MNLKGQITSFRCHLPFICAYICAVPEAPEASGTVGELVAAARTSDNKKEFVIFAEFIGGCTFFYGSVLPEVELPAAASDITTAKTKMIPNACNTIFFSSLIVVDSLSYDI